LIKIEKFLTKTFGEYNICTYICCIYKHCIENIVPAKLNNNDNKDELSLPGFTIANILQTGNWMNENFSDHLKQFSLSIQQYQVLRSLKELDGEPANLNTLQAEMVSKNSNTTRLVEKLRLKGLITRIQSEENRRKVEIRITDEGLELLTEIAILQTSFENDIVSELNEEEIITLNTLLEKIRLKKSPQS